MHLPQIATIPKVADDPVDPGRVVSPAADGEGFQTVFSGSPARSVTAAAPDSDLPDPAWPFHAGFSGLAETPVIATVATGSVASDDQPAPEQAGDDRASIEGEIVAASGAGIASDLDAARGPAGDMALGAVSGALPAMPAATPPSVSVGAPPAADAGAPAGASRVSELPGGRVSPGNPAQVPAMAPTDPPPVPSDAAPGGLADRSDRGDAGGKGPATMRPGVEDVEQPEKTPLPRPDGHPAGPAPGPVGRNRVAPVPVGIPGARTETTASPNVVAEASRATAAVTEFSGEARMNGGSGDAATARLAAMPHREGLSGRFAGAQEPADRTPPAPAKAVDPGQVNLAGHQGGDARSSGQQMPAETGESVREPRGPRSETGSAEGAKSPTGHDATKGNTSANPGPAAGAAPAGSGTEFLGAAPSGGVGAFAEGEGRDAGDAPGFDTALAEARAPARSPGSVPPAILQAPDTPRNVTLQIAEVLRASGERAVELRLQPEELGRVHLTMSQDATGTLTVALTAERAETLDLLRRNIDLLGAELRSLGYGSIDFSFRGGGAGGEPDPWTEKDRAPGALDADTGADGKSRAPTARAGPGTAGDGIDLRL